MKRLMTILGVLVLVGAVAVPVMALGPGWGHMMGWGYGPGGGGYANLTDEQQNELAALDRKFFDETKNLQDQIWTKSGELNALLNSPNPDLDKAKALQGEISDLRAKLDQERFNYDLQARKILPDQGTGYAYGRGYGRHMGPYGYGGPGTCWN